MFRRVGVAACRGVVFRPYAVQSVMRKIRKSFLMACVFIVVIKLVFFSHDISPSRVKKSLCRYVRSTYFSELYRRNQPFCEYNMSQTPTFLTVNSTLPNWEVLEGQFPMLQPGGWFKPATCRPQHRLAIIIPYRDRELHLKLFLQHMHPYLQAQLLEYTVYVIELEKNVAFQKGLLMNAGFHEVSKTDPSICYVFHDVDMLPLSTGVQHVCNTKTILHPSVYIKQYNFSKPYGRYMGGVLIFHKELFQLVNGFSNLYWGWGGEDDDMHFRLQSFGIKVIEPASNRHRYMSWSHDHQEEFKNRKQFIMSAVDRMDEEGLNSARYRILKKEKRPLYTWILIASNHTDPSYKNMTAVHGVYDWQVGKKMK